MVTDFWSGGFDLNTPAGRALHQLVAVVPRERPLTITLFGPSPLRISVDASLLSADVDLFCDDVGLSAHVRAAGLDRDQSDFCIQVCSSLNFRTIPYLRDHATQAAAAQLAAFPFLKHLGIYGYRRATLLRLVTFPVSPLEAAEKLEQLRALENGIGIAVARVNHDSVGVDVPADMERVERLLGELSLG